MQKILAGFAFSLLVSGCASLPGFSTNVSNVGGDGVSIHSSPADLRSVVVINKPGATKSYFVCPQPPGDVAFSRSAESLLKVGVDAPATDTDVSLETALKAATTALELEGRTQSVLLARDMLTFTCIQAANGLLEKQEVQANFGRIADMLEKFAESEQKRASAAVADAAAAAVTAGVDQKIVDQMVAGAQTAFDKRVSNITNALTAADGALNRTKRDAMAAAAPVKAGLSPFELATFQQLNSVDDLRSFLKDLSDNQQTVLETASK